MKAETVSKWFINRRVKLRKETNMGGGAPEDDAEEEPSSSKKDVKNTRGRVEHNIYNS
jgi:hypothetical protein